MKASTTNKGHDMLKHYFVISTLAVTLTACNSDDDQHHDAQQLLLENQAKWETLNIEQYQLEQETNDCECQPESSMPATMLVDQTEKKLMYYTDDKTITPNEFQPHYLTVSQLFAKVNQLFSETDDLIVEYHPDYGFPTRISVNSSQQVIDGGYSIRSSGFINHSTVTCLAIWRPSFELNIFDNLGNKINCDAKISWKLPAGESEVFENNDNSCINENSIKLGTSIGLLALTVEHDGYQTQGSEVHVIADACGPVTTHTQMTLEQVIR